MNKKSKYLFTLLILFVIIYSRNLFKSELFRSDDLEIHGARLANYYLALKQGQFPPRWAPNLNYTFGDPVFTVSYVVPYAMSVIWYILGFSIERSINFTFFLSILSAAIGFYAIGKLKKNPLIGTIAALLFITTPYIMTVTFLRGSFGEITFYGLLPWVFFGIEYFYSSKKKKFFIPLYSLLFTLFLVSHPSSILVSTPIIAIYIFLKQKISPQNTKPLLASIFIAGLMSQFFWTPFLVEKNHVRAGQGFSLNSYYKRFPQPLQLIWSKWSYAGLADSESKEYYTYRIGIVYLAFIFYLLFKKKFQKKSLIKFWIISFFVYTFIITPYSNIIWKLFTPLQSAQFPWRLLWVPAFSACMILFELDKKTLKKITQPVILLIVFATVSHHAIKYAKPIGYISNSDHEWMRYPFPSSSDGELNPIWFDSHKNQSLEDQIVVRKTNQPYKNNRGVIHQVGKEIENIYWDGTTMAYDIKVDLDGDILHKTAYFPGFKVFVDDNQIDINFKDEEFPGRIIFPIEKGSHHVLVKFTQDTWDRKLGSYLSIAGLSLFATSIFLSMISSLKIKTAKKK